MTILAVRLGVTAKSKTEITGENMKNFRKLLHVAAFASACCAASSQAAVITYGDFSSTAGLTVVGSAATVNTADGAVMRLTPDQTGRNGAFYSTNSLQLGANATFSTTFQFRMTHAGGTPADGLAFVLAASPTGLGSAGQGMGYQGVNNSFAIEFDTYDNGYYDGYSNNHVAVSANGTFVTSTPVSPYGQTYCFSNTAGCMSNGNVWNVTVGYDGSKLSVDLVDSVLGTTFSALHDYQVDIASILGTNQAYAGFTAATGALSENHDILNWRFADTAQLPSDVPEPATAWIVGLGLAAMAARKRSAERRS
jgi:hypothetical protein